MCVHSCSIATTSSRVFGGDVERAEVHPVLGFGDDAGLALTAERDRRPQVVGGKAAACVIEEARPASAPAPAAPTTAAPTPAAPISFRRENRLGG